MVIKLLIVFFLIAIILSLIAGCFFLVYGKGKGRAKYMVTSLTVRIGFSVALFILLFIGWYFGLLQPHALTPS
jgi:hypothetical protein